MVRPQFPQRLVEIGAAAAVDIGTIDNPYIAFAISHRSVSLNFLLHVRAGQISKILASAVA